MTTHKSTHPLRINTAFSRALLVACLATAACMATDDPEQVDETQTDSTAGAPDLLVEGLLLFVNDATLDELDNEVGLNATAAANIIAHRDGNTPAPTDDNPFDSYQELADVSYVGDAALNALVDYLFPDETAAGAGVWEEVLFDAAQSNAAVDMANNMALGSLDCNAGLSSNAASSIVAARPIADMSALADVRYVGPSALTSLRAYTSLWSTDIVVADSFDCVDFTAEQIAIAEDIINTAGYSQLARVAGRQRKIIMFPANDWACTSHFGPEPYTAPCRRSWTGLAELSDTYGIGPATMARLRELTLDWEPGAGRPDTIRDFIDRAPACGRYPIHVSNARILEAGGSCVVVSDWDETDTDSYRVRVCTNPWDDRYFAPTLVGYAWTFQASYTDPYFTPYGECILVDW